MRTLLFSLIYVVTFASSLLVLAAEPDIALSAEEETEEEDEDETPKKPAMKSIPDQEYSPEETQDEDEEEDDGE